MFSLGAVLGYALRGAGPYQVREQAGAGHAIDDYDHPDLDGVPDFLVPLLARCLRAAPGSRAPSDGFAALLATTIRAVPARRIAALTSAATRGSLRPISSGAVQVSELRAGDPAWIGPFWLRERLDDGDGADGIGPAYLGQSPLEELVTIRALRPDLAADKSLRARLTRDIAAAREVAGPHVAPLAAADLAEYAPWIGWEWVPGESLAQTVAQHGPLSWLAFEALAAGLAAGISAIHEAGVVHGNLTPGSVFLAKDGAVITGFGVSRRRHGAARRRRVHARRRQPAG